MSIQLLAATLASTAKSYRHPGRIHVAGVGKSALAAMFLAESLCTHGAPAYFLDPVTALHGGLGAVQTCDAVVAVSASGRTLELLELAQHIGGFDGGIYGRPEGCTLAEHTEVPVFTGLGPEADEVTNFVPSTSFIFACAAAANVAHAVGVLLGTATISDTHPGGNLGATRPWDTVTEQRTQEVA